MDRPLVWLSGDIKTPPFSSSAWIEAGVLLRQLQRGDLLSLPHSRPMPTIGRRVHELRVVDETKTWRIIYRIDPDAIVLVDVAAKKTRTTSKATIRRCQGRLKSYDAV